LCLFSDANLFNWHVQILLREKKHSKMKQHCMCSFSRVDYLLFDFTSMCAVDIWPAANDEVSDTLAKCSLWKCMVNNRWLQKVYVCYGKFNEECIRSSWHIRLFTRSCRRDITCTMVNETQNYILSLKYQVY